MAISVEEMKKYLNIDADNTDYDAELEHLISAAIEDLSVATGKVIDTENALVRQFIKLYCRREFDMLNDSDVDFRLLDIQKKILHSLKFAEDNDNA